MSSVPLAISKPALKIPFYDLYGIMKIQPETTMPETTIKPLTINVLNTKISIVKSLIYVNNNLNLNNQIINHPDIKDIFINNPCINNQTINYPGINSEIINNASINNHNIKGISINDIIINNQIANYPGLNSGENIPDINYHIVNNTGSLINYLTSASTIINQKN